MRFEWEPIDNYSFRMKVPGGWVLKVLEDVMRDMAPYGGGMNSGWDWRIAICFIPDPNHEWVIEKP